MCLVWKGRKRGKKEGGQRSEEVREEGGGPR